VDAFEKKPKGDGVSFAFDALKKASFEEWTRWTIVYDLATAGEGDIGKALEDYSYEKNKELVMKSFTTTEFLKATPTSVLEILSSYPATLRCTE
jgi:hypothetical protein